MSTIERAIEIAARAHAGQVDQAGAPYILHPLRVMLAVGTPHER
ncbi:MAG TPA: guanosine-3',5'-bis(diphosphate) 3'-pyrophosphohydrolase, partial [Thermoanaerobaculia bacterium]|nr:guanosine-3',5'-bis(diphosphate) 3'-pyrophosphohydrolase [Thermoanaerobaculia bacterium]